MKLAFFLLGVVLMPLVLPASAAAQSLFLDLESFGGTNGSYIVFTPEAGNTLSVTFQPVTGTSEDFALSGASIPNLNSLTGSITGSFTVSNIVNTGGLETATVTSSPSDSLVISDGQGDTETAHLWWNSTYTYMNSGSIYTFQMNAGSAENLSNFTYSGAANSVLAQDFAGITAGNALVNFSFASPDSLSAIAASSSPTTDSFAGQVTAIPEPGTYGVIVAALAGGAVLWARRRGAVGC